MPYMILRLFYFMALLLFSSGTVLAQERTWNLDATDKQAFLTLGVQDSEDVGVSLWCEIGKGRMAIFLPESKVPLRTGENVLMIVTVDGVQKQLHGLATKDAASGLMTVEGKFALKNMLIRRLQGAQTLAVRIKGHDNNFPFSEADFAGLLSTCKGELQQ